MEPRKRNVVFIPILFNKTGSGKPRIPLRRDPCIKKAPAHRGLITNNVLKLRPPWGSTRRMSWANHLTSDNWVENMWFKKKNSAPPPLNADGTTETTGPSGPPAMAFADVTARQQTLQLPAAVFHSERVAWHFSLHPNIPRMSVADPHQCLCKKDPPKPLENTDGRHLPPAIVKHRTEQCQGAKMCFGFKLNFALREADFIQSNVVEIDPRFIVESLKAWLLNKFGAACFSILLQRVKFEPVRSRCRYT